MESTEIEVITIYTTVEDIGRNNIEGNWFKVEGISAKFWMATKHMLQPNDLIKIAITKRNANETRQATNNL